MKSGTSIHEPAFVARQMPDGKWRLTKGDVSMGVFGSPAECESAIKRIIVPNVIYWNADGEPIR